jgi:hypothetical protein
MTKGSMMTIWMSIPSIPWSFLVEISKEPFHRLGGATDDQWLRGKLNLGGVKKQYQGLIFR